MLYTYILLIPIYQRSSFEKKLIVIISVDVNYQLHVNLFLRIGREKAVWSGAVAYISSSIFKICADFQEIVAKLKGRDIRGNDED